MMCIKHSLIVFSLLFSLTLFGQEKEEIMLANEYYQQGELEKAATLYNKLAQNRRNIPAIHDNYFELLIDLENYKQAKKYIRKVNKMYPANLVYLIDEGRLYLAEGREEEADAYFREMIDKIKENEVVLRRAAQLFFHNQLTHYSIKTYKEARNQINDPYAYAIELANIYRYSNMKEDMLEEYLNYASIHQNHMQHVKNILQDALEEEEDMQLFENLLVQKLQNEPSNYLYNEFLVWTNIQQHDFYGAFVQARALENRLEGDGRRLIDVGLIALENEDFKNALRIFDYIIKQYAQSRIAPMAKKFQIQAREEIVKNTYPVPVQEIHKLIADYRDLIQEIGNTRTAFEATRNMALLYAFYLNEKDTAIYLLTELTETSGVPEDLAGQSKLDLGDIYLFKDEPWESTLLYSQVEKTQKEAPLGYEAKLKNAKLHYYMGNFKLAQEHLDVLKLATTREISNDAIALSAYIKDNTILDTSDVVMKQFASIELLVYQNQYDTAIASLHQLISAHPYHEVVDEAYWMMAKAYYQTGQFSEAANAYVAIHEKFAEDILADDALFELASLYENQLNDREKAMDTYQRLLAEFPGSKFAAEARKRFRKMRGDQL